MLRYVGALVALLFTFSSCESDFELTGQYEETPLIYGIVDPSQSAQLFRIQRAFLGEESALVMAQSPDSSYFKYDDLFVEFIAYSDEDDEIERWVLDTVVIDNKDVGDLDDDEIDFFGPQQRLYSTANSKIKESSNSATVNIDADNQYEITLKKRPAGMTDNMTIANMDTVTPIADSRIEIIDPSTFRFRNPSENQATLQGATQLMLVNTVGQFINYSVRFNAVERAVQYEIWMRFHYREFRGGVETPKTIEWLVTTQEANTSGEIQVSINGSAFYSRIGSEVPEEEGVIRKIGKADGSPGDPDPDDGRSQDVDFFVRAAGEELFEYIDINDLTNSGLLLDRPVYTNINNGLGVFSSRTQFDFNDLLYLTTESYDELVDGESTSGRGFVVDPD